MDQIEPSVVLTAYSSCLHDYLRTHAEAALYQASLMSQRFVQERIGPEEIVALHVDALEHVREDFSHRDKAYAATDGLQFLLEVMIAYGVQHKEYLEMRIEDLARSEADKAQVLATIAHELGTPITAAQGNLTLASRRLAEGRLEHLPPLLTRSREAVDRLARLTHGLMEASRGELPLLELAPVEVGEVLALACEWAHPAAAEKSIALAHEVAETGVWVLGERDALLSIVSNLLSNAIRYTPAGGRVTAGAGTDGGSSWVEVRDFGIGMTPEVQARMYDKFYRAPEASAMAAQGLGLGLTLVLQLVQAQGGRIEVESAPQCGTTFRIVLPRPAV